MTATRWLARWRVTIGFILGAFALGLARPSSSSLVVGIPIALVGEGFRVWAAGHLEKSREVTMSGPYRWTRHPLYIGSTLLGIGLAVASNSLVVTAIVAIYLAATLTAAARSEERHLEAKFGDAYDVYRRGAAIAAPRRFSWERARRNRETGTIAGVFAVAALLVLRAIVG